MKGGILSHKVEGTNVCEGVCVVRVTRHGHVCLLCCGVPGGAGPLLGVGADVHVTWRAPAALEPRTPNPEP